MNKILAPQLNANENEVFIAEWKFKNNDFIKKGDHVASVETAKVIEEIYSEGEGYLERLFEKDDKVKAGQVIGNLNKQKKKLFTKKSNPEKSLATFTKKAEILINEYDIKKNEFKSDSIIRENDVVEFIKKNKIQINTEKNQDQLIILKKNNKPYHAAVYLSNLGIVDLSLLGSKVTRVDDYHFDNCKCDFFKLSLSNRLELEKFYQEPFLLTDKIIKKEKSSRGWSKSVESSDFILKFRKTRSKNFDDMNCIEWLVFGLELAGYKISENVLTATTLSKWAEEKLSKIEKKNNLATFNKNY